VPVNNSGRSPGGGKNHFLLIGKQEDPCCELVADYARSNGFGTVLLPESDLFPQLEFSWLPPSGGAITWHDTQLRFGEIAGVLNRGYGMPVTAEEYQTREGRYLTAEWNALTAAWLDRMPCPVINRLKPELWYRPRLNVADLAALVPGLREFLPPTFVTTERDEIRRLRAARPGDVFYSPLTSDAEHGLADLEIHQTLCGTLIQLKERERLHCFVTADHVVYLGPDGSLARPPSSDLTPHCVAFGKALRIGFYKLSLVVGPRGGWYCTELDRLPSLYSCSPAAQQQIAINLGRIMCDGGR
jgi:hypothetical protein